MQTIGTLRRSELVISTLASIGRAFASGFPFARGFPFAHTGNLTLPGYAYVTATAANAGASGALYQYAVGSNGSVTLMAQASISAGVNPAAVGLPTLADTTKLMAVNPVSMVYVSGQ